MTSRRKKVLNLFSPVPYYLYLLIREAPMDSSKGAVMSQIRNFVLQLSNGLRAN